LGGGEKGRGKKVGGGWPRVKAGKGREARMTSCFGDWELGPKEELQYDMIILYLILTDGV
jgi:hypothetical protein